MQAGRSINLKVPQVHYETQYLP